jgi:hypothetical protein
MADAEAPLSIYRHASESGQPGQATEPVALDSRFRGNDALGGRQQHHAEQGQENAAAMTAAG